MQAVIIASDPGQELRPLTFHIPKPLLRVGNRCIIEHSLGLLPERISELVIIIGHLGEQIKNFCGTRYNKRKITYVKQRNQLGSARALHLCKNILGRRFLVVPTDGIYGQDDVEQCLEYDQCVLAKEVGGKFSGERVILDGDGYLKDIVPGIHAKRKALINTGLYVLNQSFFNYDLIPSEGSKKCEIAPTLAKVAKDFPVYVPQSETWLPLSDQPGIKRAEKILAGNFK